MASKRVNPVEIFVLCVVGGMCAFSLFQLVQNPPELAATAERGLASQVVRENAVAQARSRSFLSLELNQCGANLDQPPTTASRARLVGTLCGFDPAAGTAQLVGTQVSNAKSGYSATVFTDLREGRFSTEYIPLQPGPNVLTIRFDYRGGKSFTQEIEITKN